MDLAAAKMIGAGLACIALVGAGIGIGNVFGSYLSGALRNPGAAATPVDQPAPRLRPVRGDRPLRPRHRAAHPVRVLTMADAATTTATTEAAPHKGAGFPPFKTETFPSQLFWLAVTFAFLFVVLWRVAGPRIAGTIGARRHRIADDLAVAQKNRTGAEAAEAAYQDRARRRPRPRPVAGRRQPQIDRRRARTRPPHRQRQGA